MARRFLFAICAAGNATWIAAAFSYHDWILLACGFTGLTACLVSLNPDPKA